MTVEVSSTRGGGSHSGLRARVAAATRDVPIPAGVRIKVDSSAVDRRYGKSLVMGLNGMGVWAHPVFGTGATTVQRGQEVFLATLRRHRAAWNRQLKRVVDRTARRIEG